MFDEKWMEVDSMRILFVSPYPASRIRIRSYGFITQLAKRHTIELLALCANTQEICDIHILQKEGIAAHAIYEPRMVRYLRSLAALASPQPLQVAFDAAPHLRKAIDHYLLSHNFDLLHIELIRTLGAVPATLSLPTVWDAVDCISQLYAQQGKLGNNWMMRLLGSYEAKRVQSYEYTQLRRFHHVLVTTERDRQALQTIAHNHQAPHREFSSKQITVLPHGIDLHYFQPYDGKRRAETLVFSGKMSFHANVAGVCMLVKSILPLIWQKRPTVRLLIAGSDPPAMVRHLAKDQRIEVTGYLPDLRPAIAQAQIAVCPLPYAVGLQNKVLEAMALGTPVIVSTPVAAGLQAVHNRDLLVADEAAGFAAAILHLLEDQTQWHRLAAHGLAYVRTYHDWNVIIEQLITLYTQVVQSSKNENQEL